MTRRDDPPKGRRAGYAGIFDAANAAVPAVAPFSPGFVSASDLARDPAKMLAGLSGNSFVLPEAPVARSTAAQERIANALFEATSAASQGVVQQAEAEARKRSDLAVFLKTLSGASRLFSGQETGVADMTPQALAARDKVSELRARKAQEDVMMPARLAAEIQEIQSAAAERDREDRQTYLSGIASVAEGVREGRVTNDQRADDRAEEVRRLAADEADYLLGLERNRVAGISAANAGRSSSSADYEYLKQLPQDVLDRELANVLQTLRTRKQTRSVYNNVRGRFEQVESDLNALDTGRYYTLAQELVRAGAVRPGAPTPTTQAPGVSRMEDLGAPVQLDEQDRVRAQELGGWTEAQQRRMRELGLLGE